MKNFYLLPVQVFLLLCLFFSSAFVFGQNVNHAKTSLQSSKVRTQLPTVNHSASTEHHRKNFSSKTENKIDTTDTGIKLKVASPNFQQAKELPENVVAVPMEKPALAQFKNASPLKQIPVKENETP